MAIGAGSGSGDGSAVSEGGSGTGSTLFVDSSEIADLSDMAGFSLTFTSSASPVSGWFSVAGSVVSPESSDLVFLQRFGRVVSRRQRLAVE